MKIFNEILDESISPTKKFNGKNVKTVRDAFELYGLNSGDIAFIKRMILGNKTPKNYLYQVKFCLVSVWYHHPKWRSFDLFLSNDRL